MLYEKSFQSFWKSEDEIKEAGYRISNEMIQKIDIHVIGHFGNLPSLSIAGKTRMILSGFNNERNLGYLIQNLLEFFELDREDGVYLSQIANVPCRIITNSKGLCIGFGHFMKDKFVITAEIMKVGVEDENS